MLASFKPTDSSLAILLTHYLRNTRDVSDAFQLPKGLEMIRPPDKSQVQLRVAPLFAHKLKRTFGYVGDIKMSSGEGCETPAQLQVITKIPWRWGPTSLEKESSWIIVRVQAFYRKRSSMHLRGLAYVPLFWLWVAIMRHIPVSSWGPL